MSNNREMKRRCREKKPELYAATQRAWYLKNKERCLAASKKHREDNREKYDVYSKKYREANRDKCSLAVKASRQKLMMEFVNEYGGSCRCCGEEELSFLTIEHSLHDPPRNPSGLRITAYAELRRLKKSGWPKDKGIYVLCYNCNCSTQIIGTMCAHKSASNRHSILMACAP